MYHSFKDSEGNEHGSFETFWFDGGRFADDDCWEDSDGDTLPAGWYWWACFPGCMPDGDPLGPFESEKEAVKDAQDF